VESAREKAGAKKIATSFDERQILMGREAIHLPQ
jgi:hypothetical protein